MSLHRRKYSEIPSDAVVLTEQEALKYQTKILNNWNNSSDIFWYKYGPFMLGGSAFLSGFFLNDYYRKKFKLHHYGRLTTFLPLTLLPSAFAALVHMEFVLKDVVLQNRETCPICLETRASALQGLVGCVFPLVLAPFANLSIAHKYGTYNLPDITSQPRQVLSLVKGKTGPIFNIIVAIFLGQAMVASAVTYFEAKSVITVNKKLAILEEQLENQ